MFGIKKKETYFVPELFGMKNVTFTNHGDLGRLLEKASALQDQNRRDYNLLFERQNLILKELGKEYVPETEKKEPAKLVDKTEPYFPGCDSLSGLAEYVLTEEYRAKKPKKRGRPKGSKDKK